MDILFLGELNVSYLDLLGLSIRMAFEDLEIPKLKITHNIL